MGWMIEASDEEAQRTYGEKLCVASLAVVQEPGKIRVVQVEWGPRQPPYPAERPGAVAWRRSAESNPEIKGSRGSEVVCRCRGYEQSAPPHQDPPRRLGIPGVPSQTWEDLAQQGGNVRDDARFLPLGKSLVSCDRTTDALHAWCEVPIGATLVLGRLPLCSGHQAAS